MITSSFSEVCCAIFSCTSCWPATCLTRLSVSSSFLECSLCVLLTLSRSLRTCSTLCSSGCTCSYVKRGRWALARVNLIMDTGTEGMRIDATLGLDTLCFVFCPLFDSLVLVVHAYYASKLTNRIAGYFRGWKFSGYGRQN